MATKVKAIIAEQKDEFLQFCEISFAINIFENVPAVIFSKRRKEVNALKIELGAMKKELVAKLVDIPVDKMSQYVIVLGGIIMAPKFAVQKLPNETPPVDVPVEKPIPEVPETVVPDEPKTK